MLLWIGELISAVGSGLTSFGLGVYVFEQTGSAADMSLVTLLGFLPTLLFSVPAGVLADRHDRRLLMMAGDGLSALGILYILICMMNGGAELWQICAGVFVSASFSALLEPSYRATVSDLLTEEEYSKASGMISLAGSARYLVSPVLAGLLLTVSDIKLLMAIDICTLLPTIIAAAAADGIAEYSGISVGRGAAYVVILSGMLMCLTALVLYSLKSVRRLGVLSYDKKADT